MESLWRQSISEIGLDCDFDITVTVSRPQQHTDEVQPRFQTAVESGGGPWNFRQKVHPGLAVQPFGKMQRLVMRGLPEKLPLKQADKGEIQIISIFLF